VWSKKYQTNATPHSRRLHKKLYITPVTSDSHGSDYINLSSYMTSQDLVDILEEYAVLTFWVQYIEPVNASGKYVNFYHTARQYTWEKCNHYLRGIFLPWDFRLFTISLFIYLLRPFSTIFPSPHSVFFYLLPSLSYPAFISFHTHTHTHTHTQRNKELSQCRFGNSITGNIFTCILLQSDLKYLV
jgi:hypothetical protein